ncbi:Hypothetical protein A7982_02240 [Minicystis rosea]|nr:Hypothetical protein A7982_02240 [Minicystis rosea]
MSTSMKTTQILKPILDGGVRSVNFFNGRLLTGEDLTREQQANREWLARLGRLAGEGVAGGLTVAPIADKPSVTVSPGVAMNALGQTLRLVDPFEVSLLRPAGTPDDTPTAPASPVPGFADCLPPESGIYRTGSGVYLLTIAPATGVEGSVPTNGLGNLVASCATRFLVDAVQFRLYSLTFAFGAELFEADRLRNAVAGRCFGVANAGAFITDPFGLPPASARLLDALGKKLPPTDVPLCVLNWTSTGGIAFIDHWSVRRRPAGPPDELVWSPALGERRVADAEAMLLQFQDHLDALADGVPEPIVAKDHFDYLPPAGVMPLGGTPGFRGFLPSVFFQGLKIRDPIYIEGARVEALLRRALRFPPMKVPSEEMLWVYHVRENAYKADGHDGARVQPYAIFASGQIPYAGEAVFDVAHWDYASFS